MLIYLKFGITKMGAKKIPDGILKLQTTYILFSVNGWVIPVHNSLRPSSHDFLKTSFKKGSFWLSNNYATSKEILAMVD